MSGVDFIRLRERVIAARPRLDFGIETHYDLRKLTRISRNPVKFNDPVGCLLVHCAIVVSVGSRKENCMQQASAKQQLKIGFEHSTCFLN
jgi:hypothetical protein